MVQVRFCLLLAALCACCGLGSSGLTAPPKSEIIPVDNNSQKSTDIPVADAPMKPAPSPDTITQSTTISSTTNPPTTTTQSTTPSTTQSTTTTTTQSTTTSSTTTPAPTPAPGPFPPPVEHTWSFPPNASNVTCIVAKFAAQLNVTYSVGGKSLANALFNIPSNATVSSGDCSTTEQFMTLSWPAPSPAFNNTLTLNYAKNDTTKSYALKSLNIQLSPDMFANASFTNVVELTSGEAWQTPLTTSYRCTPATQINMTVSSNPVEGEAASITFTKLQEEAFRTANGTQFSAARECGGDVPDAVPIAVGCALGGLVLVVLVAYLVGRRRSNARGYLSM